MGGSASEYLGEEGRRLLRQHDADTATTLSLDSVGANGRGKQDKADFLSTNESSNRKKRRWKKTEPPVLYEAEPTNASVKEEMSRDGAGNFPDVPTKVDRARSLSMIKSEGESEVGQVQREAKLEWVGKTTLRVKKVVRRVKKKRRRRKRRRS